MAVDSFGLTLKQRLFCEHYLGNGNNGTKAAIKAGYSKETSREMACENLTKPHIKKYIKERMKDLFENIGFTAEYRLKKLKIGTDISIPELSDTDTLEGRVEKIRLSDVRAGVACIAEANKMEGLYPADKHAVLIEESKTNDVAELVKQYEKDF